MSRIRRKQPALYKPRRRNESRTTPLFDETGQDNGTYYRCWHCGFTCNDERDSLGGEASRNKVTHSDFAQDAHPSSGSFGAETFGDLEDGGIKSASISLRGGYQTVSLIQVDSSGNPRVPKHLHSVSTSGGCPLCGSANWRGDY